MATKQTWTNEITESVWIYMDGEEITTEYIENVIVHLRDGNEWTNVDTRDMIDEMVAVVYDMVQWDTLTEFQKIACCVDRVDYQQIAWEIINTGKEMHNRYSAKN